MKNIFRTRSPRLPGSSAINEDLFESSGNPDYSRAEIQKLGSFQLAVARTFPRPRRAVDVLKVDRQSRAFDEGPRGKKRDASRGGNTVARSDGKLFIGPAFPRGILETLHLSS